MARGAWSSRWATGLAVASIAAATLMVACATNDKEGVGGSGSGSGSERRERDKTDQQKRIKTLIELFDHTERERWVAAREELVLLGPEAHGALLRYLKFLLHQGAEGVAFDRFKAEYAWALRATKSHLGLHYLVAAATDPRDAAGKVVYQEVYRNAAIEILEKCRDAKIQWPDLGEITLPAALMLYYKDAAHDRLADVEGDRKVQVIEMRTNLIRMLAPCGVPEDELDLAGFDAELAAVAHENAWQWRARFFEALERFDGNASKELLLAGAKDADPSVRAVANDTLKRRIKRERQATGSGS